MHTASSGPIGPPAPVALLRLLAFACIRRLVPSRRPQSERCNITYPHGVAHLHSHFALLRRLNPGPSTRLTSAKSVAATLAAAHNEKDDRLVVCDGEHKRERGRNKGH